MIQANEYILCAAIHYKDGFHYEAQPRNIESGFVICGRRHHNCIILLSQIMPNYNKILIGREGQGFITNLDRYVDRAEAYKIAKEAGQIKHDLHDKSNPILVSEDLY